MKSEYLSAAATAKLIRAALKKAFPKVVFGVRSKTYSMGASIDVSWTDGPPPIAVDAIVKPFSGASFDAMEDLKSHHDYWLMPDGSVSRTEQPGGRLVHSSADFVFTQRRVTPALLLRVRARLEHHGYPVEVIEVRTSADGSGYTFQTTFDREVTRGFDMEREMRTATSRTYCTKATA